MMADTRPSAAYVIARLEQAGATLLALPHTGHSTHMRTGGLSFAREAIEAYGWSPVATRAPRPSAAKISAMDEALAWVSLIPQNRYVLRRVVGARLLVSPMTGRYLYAWRRLGVQLGADHKAVQRWHAQGIDMIVTRLTASGYQAVLDAEAVA